MGTDPTGRIFFRRLAVEAGEDYGADEIAASGREGAVKCSTGR